MVLQAQTGFHASQQPATLEQAKEEVGSPGWNRTNDQRINSPMLYR